MHPCSIYSMDSVKTIDLLRNSRTRNLMYQCPKTGVFLRRPPHNSERPNRIFTVIYAMYLHQREWVHQGIITNMIAKRSFGLVFIGVNRSCNHKVCIRGYTEPFIIIEISKSPVP